MGSFLRSGFFAQAAILSFALGAAAQSDQAEPAEFTANPNVGEGGSQFTDSPHFRVYGVSASAATPAINELEAAYDCFVGTLGWRSTGLSFDLNQVNGTYWKTNVYGVDVLEGAAGVMGSDYETGLGFLTVQKNYLAEPAVTVHEFGHVMTYHERTWVDQGRTGAWWETVAEFVADTYLTSPLCKEARDSNSISEGRTIIQLNKVISDSHQVIVDGTVDSGNYYQAWPFLSYLTYNPDNYTGLGTNAIRDMFRKYDEGSNETPFHVLARVASNTTVQTIVGRYWARMAYVDIGHTQAHDLFTSARSTLNYANLDSTGSGSYKVKSARQPKYMGANIIPLKGTGEITAKISAAAAFTATFAILSGQDTVRYVNLANGTGSITVGSDEEASLVIVNTPSTLYDYDAFAISGDAAKGLDYTLQLTGATA